MASETYRTVARVGEISEGKGHAVMIGDRAVAIVLDEGTYYAIDDRCPHMGIPLCDGIVCDKTITCTWHGWRFSLEGGEWVDNPTIRVGTYPVRLVGDEIQVRVEETGLCPSDISPGCAAPVYEAAAPPVDGLTEDIAERTNSGTGATH